jgi:hypothetical protein
VAEVAKIGPIDARRQFSPQSRSKRDAMPTETRRMRDETLSPCVSTVRASHRWNDTIATRTEVRASGIAGAMLGIGVRFLLVVFVLAALAARLALGLGARQLVRLATPELRMATLNALLIPILLFACAGPRAVDRDEAVPQASGAAWAITSTGAGSAASASDASSSPAIIGSHAAQGRRDGTWDAVESRDAKQLENEWAIHRNGSSSASSSSTRAMRS